MLGTGHHVWSTSPRWARIAMLDPRCPVASLSPCRGARNHVESHRTLEYHNFIVFPANMTCGLPTSRRKLERALAPLEGKGVPDPKYPISK